MDGRPNSSTQPSMDERGRYDRGQTALERRAARIARLVTAAAGELRAKGRGHTTVSDVVRRARVGRNTFYQSFRDLEHLLLQLEETALEDIWRRASAALADAVTPIEKLRALTRAWIGAARDQPELVQAALDAPARSATATSRAGDALARLMSAALQSARRDAVLVTQPDELRLLAATAMLEALGRRYAESGGDAAEFESTLLDLLLRTFR